ncbi:MBL fold metallo-hydrolase [Colwelliaceae bacterium 6471]
MKLIPFISSAVAISVSLAVEVSAENYTQENVRQSQEIINQVLDTYGGADKISGFNSVIVDYDVTNINAGQSRKPNPPWDTSKNDRIDAFDFTKQIAVTRFNGSGAGNLFAATNVTDGDNSANYNDILKTRSKVTEPNFDASAGPGLRTNATFLLKRLQQYANTARYMGEFKMNGVAHDLLSFTMPAGPAITLYIDKKTHRITKSERVAGPFLVEYYFKDYKQVDGILFPFENSYTVDGLPAQTFKVDSYKINHSVDEYTQAPKGYIDIAATLPATIKTNHLGDGVYWVTQNGQNSLFVEFEDHTVMIGGLPGVAQRIAEIKKTLPTKPVKYTVMTHHHSDHIGGSQEVQDAGIKFVAVQEHEQVIRETLAEQDRKLAKFEFVNNKKVFTDGRQTLEIYDIGPTEHTEHLLLAYLPKQGIIFEADHFGAPAAGPMPPRTPNIEALVNAINKRGLKVTKITSAHASTVATFEQLMESYHKTI